jgi:hypothetical protein
LASKAVATLNAASALTGTELFYADDGSADVRVTADQIKTFMGFPDVLTANRTYYVRSDGDDANDGLADTAAGAFSTIQAGVNAAALVIPNGFKVTVKVADGVTETNQVVLVPGVSPGNDDGTFETYALEGNITDPSQVVISTTSEDAIFVPSGCYWFIRGVKVQTTTSGSGIRIEDNSFVFIDNNMQFGTCAGKHIECYAACLGVFGPPYEIVGGATYHYFSYGNSRIFAYPDSDIIVTGTPGFSGAFAFAGAGGVIDVNGNSVFTGSATGTRFDLASGGSIGGVSSITAFPGDVAGTVTGGYYGNLAGASGLVMPNNARIDIGSADFSSLLVYSTASANGPTLAMQHASPSPANNDYIGGVTFRANDGAGNDTLFAGIAATALDVTSTSEDAKIEFNTLVAASETVGLYVQGGATGLPSYTVVGVPSASPAGRIIYVSNATGGAQPFFSDGSDWRRVADLTTVS